MAVVQSLRETTSDMATSFGVLDEERRSMLVVLLNSATHGMTIDELRAELERYLGE